MLFLLSLPGGFVRYSRIRDVSALGQQVEQCFDGCRFALVFVLVHSENLLLISWLPISRTAASPCQQFFFRANIITLAVIITILTMPTQRNIRAFYIAAK